MNLLHLLAIVLGISVCLQGTANGLLTGRIGLPLTLTINSGLVFAGSLIWLFVARTSGAANPEHSNAPWSYYSGGICGLLIISCAAVAYPRLGASTTTVLAVASQIATALILDRFGATGVRVPLSAGRLIGLCLVAVGVALVLGIGDKPAR